MFCMSDIAMVWTGSVLKGTGENGSSTWNCCKGVETFQRWDLMGGFPVTGDLSLREEYSLAPSFPFFFQSWPGDNN